MMKKIIDELINSSISGVDVYRYKNATWLIFTGEGRWVVELTDEGTLWYNYKFFNDVFKYVSMTVGKEMEEYVIQWANDYFYKDCAHRSIAYPMDKGRNKTPKVLKNGVKETKGSDLEIEWHTREVMNEGVKEILNSMMIEPKPEFVEEVIDEGIKEVYDSSSTHRQMRAKNLIPRIVKDVKPHRVIIPVQGMDRFYYDPGCSANTMDINHIVKEGIKNIYPDQNSGDYDWSNEFEADKVIERGVKL